MKVMAAVVWAPRQGFDVTEVELDPPKEREALIRWVATGLCHSDYHVMTGTYESPFPIVGGHEGAGIVEHTGPGVTRVKVGDHVVGTFLPSCGYCRWCSTGYQGLCDLGQSVRKGPHLDGTFRFHARDQGVASSALLGTFSQYSVVPEYSLVKIDKTIPLESACLVSCGVLTGWGAAVVGADVEPGDTVVIYGAGGLGMNAVQGARFAGAKNVVAIDPVAFKRQQAIELGATHVVASADEASDTVYRLTSGVGADKSIITVGVIDAEVVQHAFDIVRKAGTIAVASAGDRADSKAIQISARSLTGTRKRIQGVIAGNLNVHYEIPRLLELYRAGYLKLDELVTGKYKLEEINQGYRDLIEGKNIRGIIVFDG